jgi:protein-tyrosine phosphatase
MGVIKLEAAWNVRDLGSLPLPHGAATRNGVFFRGDSLDSITSSDEGVLFGRLEINLIIDLRTSEELTITPPHTFPGVRLEHMSLIREGRLGREPFPSQNPTELASVYLDNLEDGATTAAKAIQYLVKNAEEGGASLFHCAAGRDRTGILAALLLKSVGAADEVVIEDYVASNHHLHHVSGKLANNPLYANGRNAQDRVFPLLEGTMEEFLRIVVQRYGDVPQFLVRNGLPEEFFLRLHEVFVDSRRESAPEDPS